MTAQCLARQVLKDQVRTLTVFAQVEDNHDVLVPTASCRVSLTQKPLSVMLASGEEKLDSNMALQLAVVGEKNLAHATGAEASFEPVAVANAVAGLWLPSLCGTGLIRGSFHATRRIARAGLEPPQKLRLSSRMRFVPLILALAASSACRCDYRCVNWPARRARRA